MKVCAFVGSPRLGGNTDILVSEVLRGAASAGANVEKHMVSEMDISPCQACEVCRQTGRCCIQDDMQPLYDVLLEADTIVLGTPIYFWGPSAQLKGFIDRWYAFDQDGIRERLAAKRLLLVCAFADSDPDTGDATIRMVRLVAKWFDMRFLDPLLGIAWKRGEIAENREIIQRAYRAGVDLAR